jgi:hypothetical protein
LPIVEKINIKYLGTTEHPLAKMIMENTKNGIQVVIELTPKFFSAWDFSKAVLGRRHKEGLRILNSRK